MPIAPRGACLIWPCKGRAGYRGLCEYHAKAHRQQRGTRTQQGYGADWQKARAEHLAKHPWCVVCGARATDVDHIESIRTAPHRRLDPTNFRSMCHSHHSRRTATEQSGWGRGRKSLG